jgi:hypothetical protein
LGRLVWDTFPKSGSAWLARTVELAYPNHEVVWGGHRIATLRRETNVITCIRDPRDAVASYLIFFQHDDPERLLDWYCRFMVGTIENAHRIFVTDFNSITVKPESVMRAYASRFDLSEPQPVTLATIEAKVKETHAAHLPKPLTAERIEANQRVLDSPSLPAALDLYEQTRLLRSGSN